MSFIRYLCVGVVNTCVGLSVIYVGIYWFRLDDIPANLLGYCAGISCSFLLNRSWTFASGEARAPQAARFLMVMGAAYLVNIGAVMVMIKVLAVQRPVAHALGSIPYTLVGFLGSRYFAFRQ